MAVKEQPTQYLSHGKPFPTKEAAELHDALHTAREELEAAQRKFERMLGESATTADGQPFRFDVWADYYYVFEPFGRMPCLEKFSFRYGEWRVRDAVDHPDVIEIRDKRKSEPEQPDWWVQIRKLHSSEESAMAQLIKAQRKWLEAQQRAIENEAAKWQPV